MSIRASSHDDVIVALFLAVGVFLPTSSNGEPNHPVMLVGFGILLVLLARLTWKYGPRPGAVATITLPICIILTACTFVVLGPAFPFDWATFIKFSSLAMVLALNLRNVRPGPLVSVTFFATNVIWIIWGTAVVIGNERLGDFMANWYTQFYPDLVSAMVALHKPVLTFGTHSLAGFFTYLFFWLNWESYKSRRGLASALFAGCHFVLLIALTSFTSLIFAGLAALQAGFWLWKHRRRIFLAWAVCLSLATLLAGSMIAEEIDTLWKNPQVAGLVLNTDNSGLLVRYGSGGALTGTLDYLWNHPFAPIGFTFPTFLFLGDSGPVQYVLKGSVPLLLLIYIGLYQFFRHNLARRDYALWFFFVVLAFEIGFNSLPYVRTLFLLPFMVVYLSEIASRRSMDNVPAG